MGNPPGSPHPSNPSGRPLAIALGLKALARPELQELQPLLVGCRRWLESSYALLRQHSPEPLRDPATLEMIDVPLDDPITPGKGTADSGAASFAWLTKAAELVLRGRCQALVTAPIAKACWHAAGHIYPGQTERLADLSGVDQAAMLFTARAPGSHWRLNTLLATTHMPLAAVPGALSPALIERQLDTLLAFCQRFATRPHLMVAGLNPHAGEAGALGTEERDWLEACLSRWQQQHPDALLDGPLPPDTCWLDAAAALYHDQGLIPVKLLAFDAAVNTTLGLPFLRTSPDHGTGFAIAGQGVARADSMAAAISTALELG